MSDETYVERTSANGRAAEASLEELLTFERLLADLSARFANASIVQVETEIDSALNHLQEFLGFDRSNFYEFTADGWATILGSAARAGVDRLPLGPAPAVLSWYLGQVRAGKVMRVQSIEDYSPEAIEQIAYHRRVGIRSSLGLPLRVSGRIVGAITFVSFRSTRNWPDDLIARLKVVGQVMAQALMRKRAEDALRESEQRFRDFTESAADWYWETGPDHRFVTINEQLCDIRGLSTARLGTARWEFACDLEEEPEKWRLHLANLDAHKPFRDFRYRMTSVDGSEVHISTSGKPLLDTEGRFLGYRGVASHITAAVRAAQLEEALQETQSKLERITRLTTMHAVTASIAHEVNQPLAAIVTNGNAALRWLRKSPPDVAEAIDAVDQIISGGHRASQVVKSVRTMFKKNEHAKVRLDVNEVIEEILTLLRGELNSRRVSVRTELSQELPLISADRVQLQQVVLNLVMNAGEAMDAMPVGARMLTIRSEACAPNEVIIAVEDSGPGIDPKDTDRIFDAFFTTKPQGMGMGLSICRSIIESHGGGLWASARRPHGSIFYVKLLSTPSHDARDG